MIPISTKRDDILKISYFVEHNSLLFPSYLLKGSHFLYPDFSFIFF